MPRQAVEGPLEPVEGLPAQPRIFNPASWSRWSVFLASQEYSPLLPGSPPEVGAALRNTCRRTPLHWKRTLDEMIDALLKAKMIEQVREGTGDFLFEAFLVPKPRDPTGPPRLVVDYSPLKHCFDRNGRHVDRVLADPPYIRS